MWQFQQFCLIAYTYPPMEVFFFNIPFCVKFIKLHKALIYYIFSMPHSQIFLHIFGSKFCPYICSLSITQNLDKKILKLVMYQGHSQLLQLYICKSVIKLTVKSKMDWLTNGST